MKQKQGQQFGVFGLLNGGFLRVRLADEELQDELVFLLLIELTRFAWESLDSRRLLDQSEQWH